MVNPNESGYEHFREIVKFRTHGKSCVSIGSLYPFYKLWQTLATANAYYQATFFLPTILNRHSRFFGAFCSVGKGERDSMREGNAEFVDWGY